MNNLAETVWHEDKVILGAIIGSDAFEVQHEGEKVIVAISGKEIHAFKLGLDNPEDPRITVPIEDCTLLTRSIDSLTDEELLEAESTFNIPSYKSVTKWLMDNKERLDVFIWLLSKGIWTGSTKNTEVIK